MKLTDHEMEKIHAFFANGILADCFIQLYNYQLITVEDLILEVRGDQLIGFKREGERLRVYVSRAKDQKFYIKIKSATPHLFLPAELVNYQRDIDLNNKLLAKDPTLFKLSSHANAVPQKGGEPSVQAPTVDVKLMKSGRKHVTVKNLPIDDASTLLEQLSVLRSEGAKTVTVTVNRNK